MKRTKSIELGKRYNSLTAIKLVEQLKGNQLWQFKCDCGKEVVTRKSAILQERTQSCGCYKKEVLKMRHDQSIQNNQFGKLKAIKYHSRSNGKTAWTCQCACGRLLNVYLFELLNGSKTSCGCDDRSHLNIPDSRFSKHEFFSFLCRGETKSSKAMFYLKAARFLSNLSPSEREDVRRLEITEKTLIATEVKQAIGEFINFVYQTIVS